MIRTTAYVLFIVSCFLPSVIHAQVQITDIQVFQPISLLNNRGDQHLAIDDDNSTRSFLTPSFTASPHIAALDLGSLTEINRFRADKGGDTDGTGNGAPGLEPIDNMDLKILYTTDSGPLEQRSYLPVSGLINGFNGTELINADDVDATTAMVDNDHHDSEFDGLYSLTFDNVQATALGIQFARDSGDGAPWTHYYAWELDAMLDNDEYPIEGIDVFQAPVIGRPLNTRNDAANAIDTDNSTWSFLTPSGTSSPHIAGLDLNGSTTVNRIRIDKWGDTDDAGGGSGAPGLAPIDNMDLQLLYTTDNGPLNERTYQPVSGLTNGFGGTELINADAVNPGEATVDNDHHETLDDGIFSLSFDTVEATGIGLRFERDAEDSTAYTHYRAWEIELLEDSTFRDISDIQVFGADLPGEATAELNNRGDEQNAIDGDDTTISYLTPSGTSKPNIVSLDWGGEKTIDRIRVAKGGNIDGLGAGAPGLEPIDNMDLEILVTTDSGPLESRNYVRVSSLTNGYQGEELIEADEVLADGFVDNDHHDFEFDGWYSLSFAPVQATALAISFARDSEDSAPYVHYFSYELEVYESAGILGDFDMDGALTVADIDLLVSAVAGGENNLQFDLTGDGAVNEADMTTWVKDLANTWIGDSNVDGEFNSSDLVGVFVAGKYEQDMDAVWSEGDWTGDLRFASSDLVAAFVDAGFEMGHRGGVQDVPEPVGIPWLVLLLGMIAVRRRSRVARSTS